MILFSYDSEQIWRHSSTARYLVLDTTTNKVKQGQALIYGASEAIDGLRDTIYLLLPAKMEALLYSLIPGA